MRLWRTLRTALRPPPRPGVVLSEGWAAPPGSSGTPDHCDCDAWGTEKEHRPETWTHSSDFRPLDTKVAACPRWKPKPQTAGWETASALVAATLDVARRQVTSRPEYRRPAPTSVPGGGKKRHA